MKSNFSQLLDTVKTCRLCGGKYTDQQITLIDHSDTATVAHITCAACQHSTLVFLGKTNRGIGFLGLSTDLSGEDAARFKKSKPVSEEVVLKAHHLLETDQRALVAQLYYQSLLP